MNFVLVHGAWCGGWWMSRLAAALRRRGAEVYAPTLTGLGEREHLASAEVGLTTHIQDVIGVLHYEELHDVVLVGHSYGGAVATGVADRARERIRRLIYMDAFVLQDGQSVGDACPPGMTGVLTELAQNEGDGWKIPSPFTMEQFGLTDPDDIAWNERLITMQPLKTLLEPLTLQPEPVPFSISYIHCSERALGLFDPFAARAQAAGWDYHKKPWTHAAPVVIPDECAGLLIDIANS